jgi:hypothetical protein
MLQRIVFVAAILWSGFALVVNAPYLTDHPPGKYWNRAYIKAAHQQIVNPDAPVDLTPPETKDLFVYALHYSIGETTARQWHSITSVLLLIVATLAWPRRGREHDSAI